MANIPPRAVWSLIQPYETKAEWDKLFKTGRILEKIDEYSGLDVKLANNHRLTRYGFFYP